MPTKELTDRTGKFIGKITDGHSGRQEAYDRNGSFCGHYNPGEDATYDSTGAFYGRGNLLAALITESST